MGLKKKITQAMENYVQNMVLPCAYKVAVKAGFVGDQSDFNEHVLAEMKVQYGIPSDAEDEEDAE